MKARIWPVVLLLAMSLVFTLFGCSSSSESTSETTETTTTETTTTGTTTTEAPGKFTWGFLTVITGSAAAYGIDETRMFDMWLEEVNGEGGIEVGGKKYLVDYKLYDTAYNPATAVTSANQLTSDGYHFALGFGGGIQNAMQPVLNEGKVLYFTSISGGVEFTNPDNPYTYRCMPSSTVLYQKALKQLHVEALGAKKLVYMGPNDETGRIEADTIEKVIEEQNLPIEINMIEFLERDAVDFVPSLTRVLATNPDVIDTGCFPAAAFQTLVKQARELGYEGWFVPTTSGLSYAPVVKAVGNEAASKIIFVRAFTTDDPITPGYAEFVEKYVDKYEALGAGFIIEQYAVLQWWKQAIEKVGSFDPDVFIKEAEGFEANTILGPVKFTDPANYGIDREIDIPICTVKIDPSTGNAQTFVWLK